MSTSDDVRELRALVAGTLMTVDEVLPVLKDDEGLAHHYRIVKWLQPMAQSALQQLRDGKELTLDSDELIPVHALDIVMDHVDYLVDDALAEMDDDEYDRMMEEMRKGT